MNMNKLIAPLFLLAFNISCHAQEIADQSNAHLPLVNVTDFNKYVLGKTYGEVLHKFNIDTAYCLFEPQGELIHLSINSFNAGAIRFGCPFNGQHFFKDIWNTPITYLEVYNSKGVKKIKEYKIKK